jgi:hypothetical protein
MKFEYIALPVSELREQQDAILRSKPNNKRGGFNGITKYGKPLICSLISLEPIPLEYAIALVEGDEDLQEEYYQPVGVGMYLPIKETVKASFLVEMPGEEMSTLPLQPFPIVGPFTEWAPVARRRTKRN